MKKNRRKVYGMLQLIHILEDDYWTWEIHLSDYPTSLLPFANLTSTIRRGTKSEALQDARSVESLLNIIEYRLIDSK